MEQVSSSSEDIPARMRGVLLPGGSRVELREFPVPVPGPGQVLVRMRASSICASRGRAGKVCIVWG